MNKMLGNKATTCFTVCTIYFKCPSFSPSFFPHKKRKPETLPRLKNCIELKGKQVLKRIEIK